MTLLAQFVYLFFGLFPYPFSFCVWENTSLCDSNLTERRSPQRIKHASYSLEPSIPLHRVRLQA